MMQRETSNSSACIPDSQDTVSDDATPEKEQTCQGQAQGANLQEILYLSRILKNEGTVARDHVRILLLVILLCANYTNYH